MRTVHYCLCIAAAAATLVAEAPNPAKLKPEGYVSDFAHVIDASNRQAIELYCGNYERATGVQMAMVTLPNLDGEPIEDFSSKLFHNWGIGQKGSSEGVLLLLSIEDKKSRIEVGYGLEQYLNDAKVGVMLRSVKPLLQQSNYGGAMLQVAQQMGDAITKGKGIDVKDQPAQSSPATGGGFQESIPIPLPLLIFLLILGAFIFIRILSSASSRTTSGRRYGGGGGPNVFWGGGGGGGGGGFGGGDSGGGGGFGGFDGGDSGGGGASDSW